MYSHLRVINLFHNNFSPSVKQLEHRKLAEELWQPTAGSIAIFHNYCCYAKRGGITTNLTTKSLAVCCWCVKIPRCGYMGHGLKLITFYVQKHTAALEMCHNQPLVRHKPLRAPASVKLVCESECPRYLICIMSFKIILLTLLPIYQVPKI